MSLNSSRIPTSPPDTVYCHSKDITLQGPSTVKTQSSIVSKLSLAQGHKYEGTHLESNSQAAPIPFMKLTNSSNKMWHKDNFYEE